MQEINLYIDESGNLGSGMGRYFLICALEIDKKNAKAISKRAGRVINRYKINKGINKTSELKGWSLKANDRLCLINSIIFKNVKIRYVVLDKNNTTMILKKSDDKNACYNYLIQLIVKNIIKDYKDIKEININMDNRTVKIGNRLFLKPYLYNKLVIEQLEKKKNIKSISFNINYYESNNNYLIQWADIISNSLYKKYNSNDETFYKVLKKKIVYQSKFPSKRFGK